MKKTLKLILALSLSGFFSLQSVFCQNNNNSIDSFLLPFEAAKTTCGTFTQKRFISKSKRTFKSNGNFTVCSKGVILNAVTPVKNTTVISDKAIIQIDSKGNQTVLDSETSKIFTLVSQMMTALLSGSALQLESFFYSELITCDEQTQTWEIKFSPKDLTIATAIDYIAIKGNSDKIILEEMKMQQQSGDYILYEFQNHQQQENLTSQQEEFFSEK